MTTYNLVAVTNESTVVTEYIPQECRDADYQSEAAMEKEFIKQLCSQGYEYVKIESEAGLIANLRNKIELLNNYKFKDSEWDSFFSQNIAGANEGVVEKTRKIQEDYVQILKCDNGIAKNILLIDKKNIHNNRLQVLNQYTEEGGTRETRYDVTILVNGLPLVHVELKKRGSAIREAFKQIKRYQRDSFWASSGLYEYVQLFVISNGTHTKYYSNTTRNQHIKESLGHDKSKDKKTSNSFEFTSFWADASNRIIADLMGFTKTFLSKHTILNVLTRYCVFTSDELLLVMRPYQIAATERILNKINIATNYKKTGTINAGGYVWHTTGSGKTLTSFKVAQLATTLSFIDKVIFIVDRKDLDYQTMKEYDRFEKGAANGNNNTKVLQKQLEDPNVKIVVTTIQKLGVFIKKKIDHAVYKEPTVLIFDECHRSQFGVMHSQIIKSFKNYYIFGFTGTPIFVANSREASQFRTTEQTFGEKLHSYTIADAINDGNVLPFRIDYINTMKVTNTETGKAVNSPDTEKFMEAPERVREVTNYIIERFDQKTKRNSFYSFNGRGVAGFNSIFATSSISMAIKYYNEFKRQLAERNRNLVVTTIYSFSPNEDGTENELLDESLDTNSLDKSSRDFLDEAIIDYNKIFGVSFDTSQDKFQNYYKDISQRVKNREIDILIVVNMFLTGFDATTLNTLWIDKNLKQHGLLQAFSRTNRILNSVKTFGNIVCFRDLKEATDEAIALFGNKETGQIALLRTYNEYYNGYTDADKYKPGYVELVSLLKKAYPLKKDIIGEEAKEGFIRLFGSILRLRNILTAFDEFEGNEILSEREFQDYQSKYIDLYQELSKEKDEDKKSIKSDIVFEIELIKQIEVNVDYIIMLVEKYYKSNCTDKDILTTIDKSINASIKLRSKRELIQEFIKQVDATSSVEAEWLIFVEKQKEKDLLEIIESENLKPDETLKFIASSFRDGEIKTFGMDVDRILPPVSRFTDNSRTAIKQTILERLMLFFEKYVGLV